MSDEAPRPSESWVGAVLDGRYRLDAPLASGGMGAVYRATQLRLGAPVAVKLLRSTWAAREDLRERFRREAFVLARLRHPAIVSILDYGVHEQTPYLVMEIVQGRSIASILADEGPLPPEQAVEVALGVISALEIAHAEGVIHRDIKPGNIMALAPPGVGVKLLDFGLALVTEGPDAARLTRADMVQGTPNYMAPEQCTGHEPITPASNVYALGTTLYEMLSGHAPFEHAAAAHVMALQLFAVPRALSTVKLPVALPNGLSELVARTLAKRPADRPTLAALRDGLQRCIDDPGGLTAEASLAQERARVGSLTRAERALTAASSAGASPAPPKAITRPERRPFLWLWGLSAAREGALQTALSLCGLDAAGWFSDAPPAPSLDDVVARVCVVPFGPESAARIAAAQALVPPLAVLVVDVPTADDTAAMIRAGAADVASIGLDDSAIGPKIGRLLRRRR